VVNNRAKESFDNLLSYPLQSGVHLFPHISTPHKHHRSDVVYWRTAVKKDLYMLKQQYNVTVQRHSHHITNTWYYIRTSWYWRRAAMKQGLSPLMSSSPRCWTATREYHRVHVSFTLATNPTTEFDLLAPSWYVSTPHTIRPLCTAAHITILSHLPLLLRL